MAGCVSFKPPTRESSVVTDLIVHNAGSPGRAANTYRIAQHLGNENGRLYVDRASAIRSPIPSFVRGATFIQTADGDRTVAASANFMSFVVNDSSTVYGAHDTRITAKPGVPY
jgi:hypothetical protein